MDFSSIKTYYNWERRPAYVTPDGRTVHFLYTLGATGERFEGGQIWAFESEVSPVDAESSSAAAKRIGQLSWNRKTVQYIEVNEEWGRQNIATEMWRLARVEEPGLSLGSQLSSTGGKQFARHLRENGML